MPQSMEKTSQCLEKCNWTNQVGKDLQKHLECCGYKPRWMPKGVSVVGEDFLTCGTLFLGF